MNESAAVSSDLLELTRTVGMLAQSMTALTLAVDKMAEKVALIDVVLDGLEKRVELLEMAAGVRPKQKLHIEWYPVGTLPEVPYETTSTQRGDCR